MLDLEIASPPTDVGTDIVSVADVKRGLRISTTNTRSDDEIEEAILAAGDTLHGINGTLGRTLFPTTYIRYLRRFPDLLDDDGKNIGSRYGAIPLPYPPLLSVSYVLAEDGESPSTEVSAATWTVTNDGLVSRIELLEDQQWPSVDEAPRAVSITYRAGYTTYPPALKRMVKILATHYFQNPSATINEIKQTMINRRVAYGLDALYDQFKVPHDYSGWL